MTNVATLHSFSYQTDEILGINEVNAVYFRRMPRDFNLVL